MNLAIRNTLPENASDTLRPGNQMAQQNVRERLGAAFGDEAGMVVGRVDDCYQVRLYFPVVAA